MFNLFSWSVQSFLKECSIFFHAMFSLLWWWTPYWVLSLFVKVQVTVFMKRGSLLYQRAWTILLTIFCKCKKINISLSLSLSLSDHCVSLCPSVCLFVSLSLDIYGSSWLRRAIMHVRTGTRFKPLSCFWIKRTFNLFIPLFFCMSVCLSLSDKYSCSIYLFNLFLRFLYCLLFDTFVCVFIEFCQSVSLFAFVALSIYFFPSLYPSLSTCICIVYTSVFIIVFFI